MFIKLDDDCIVCRLWRSWGDFRTNDITDDFSGEYNDEKLEKDNDFDDLR